jgi:hypothetical protein
MACAPWATLDKIILRRKKKKSTINPIVFIYQLVHRLLYLKFRVLAISL